MKTGKCDKMMENIYMMTLQKGQNKSYFFIFSQSFCFFERTDKWNTLPKIWKTFGRQVREASRYGLRITYYCSRIMTTDLNFFLVGPWAVAVKRSCLGNVQSSKSGN